MEEISKTHTSPCKFVVQIVAHVNLQIAEMRRLHFDLIYIITIE